MARMLTLVTVLALAAGLSLGLFVSEVRAKDRPETVAVRADPFIERMVDLYVARYELDARDAAEVRATLREYDQRVRDLLLRLRQQYAEERRRGDAERPDEFQVAREKADARIRSVIERSKGR